MSQDPTLWKAAVRWINHDTVNLTVLHPLDVERRILPLLRGLAAVGERPTVSEFRAESKRAWTQWPEIQRAMTRYWQRLADNPYHRFRGQRGVSPAFGLLDTYAKQLGLPDIGERLVRSAQEEVADYARLLGSGADHAAITRQGRRLGMALNYLELRHEGLVLSWLEFPAGVKRFLREHRALAGDGAT